MVSNLELNSARTTHMLFIPANDKSVGLELGRVDDAYQGGLPAKLVWKYGTDSFGNMVIEREFDAYEKDYSPMCLLSISRIHCSGACNMENVLKYMSLKPPRAGLSPMVRLLRSEIDDALSSDDVLPEIEPNDFGPIPNRWENGMYETSAWWFLAFPEFVNGDWIWLDYKSMSTTSRVTLFKCLKETAFEDMCGVIEQGVELLRNEGNAGMRNLSSALGVVNSGENPYRHLDSVKLCGVFSKAPKLWDLSIVCKLGVKGALEAYEAESETRSAASDTIMSMLREAEESGRPVRSSWRQAG